MNFLEPLVERGIESLVPRLRIEKSKEEAVRQRALTLSQQLIEKAYDTIPHAPAIVAAGILVVVCTAEEIPLSVFDVAKRTGVDYAALVLVASQVDNLMRSK